MSQGANYKCMHTVLKQVPVNIRQIRNGRPY